MRDVHIGGFCAFGGVELVPPVMLNPTYGPTILGQPLELAAILNRLQGLSTVPLLVAADFEHGVGMRINGGTLFPARHGLRRRRRSRAGARGRADRRAGSPRASACT